VNFRNSVDAAIFGNMAVYRGQVFHFAMGEPVGGYTRCVYEVIVLSIGICVFNKSISFPLRWQIDSTTCQIVLMLHLTLMETVGIFFYDGYRISIVLFLCDGPRPAESLGPGENMVNIYTLFHQYRASDENSTIKTRLDHIEVSPSNPKALHALFQIFLFSTFLDHLHSYWPETD